MNEARFWGKVDRRGEGECWPWTGTRSAAGYGRFAHDGRTTAAHRISYELVIGPIPAGLVLDHLCRNTSCVNPAHLEAVTDQVNILRGTGPSAVNAVKTHCYRGHPFTGDNLLAAGDDRACKVCRAENSALNRAKERALRASLVDQLRVLRPTTRGTGIEAERTHCPKGHPYSGDNLYIARRGDRRCRECARASRQAHQARLREAVSA